MRPEFSFTRFWELRPQLLSLSLHHKQVNNKSELFPNSVLAITALVLFAMKYSVSLRSPLFWVASAGLLLSSMTYVSAKAILGVDLGSIYMKVALVQRGAPLEIVTNMHSKRKTEQMILFDQGTRLYGSDANSLLARKPTKTPIAMSVMLGRDEDHPAVKVSD